MQIPIHIFKKSVVGGKLVHNTNPIYFGYAEMDSFSPEDVWNLCNWEHWADTKPDNLFADISSCDHGLLLMRPGTEECWLALSDGWLSGNKENIIAYVERHKHDIWWGEKEERE